MSETRRGGKAGRRLKTETRKRRITAALDRLAAGGTVSARDMKGLLSARQCADYQDKWDYQKSLRQDAKDASAIFDKYHRLLRKADLLEGKGEHHHGTALSHKFHTQSEYAYETALEVLEETLQMNPGAERHLDRPMFGAIYGPDKGNVPRVKYSGFTIMGYYVNDEFTSKAEVKAEMLRYALNAPDEAPEVEQPAELDWAKLKELLAGFKARKSRGRYA
jgi:hypothetical protein